MSAHALNLLPEPRHARRVRARIAAAQATIKIHYEPLRLICLDVARARELPLAAILSPLRVPVVAAARYEIWHRAERDLHMSQTAIAWHFNVTPSAVSVGIRRATPPPEPEQQQQFSLALNL